MSHECRGISYHQQLYCLFNSSLRLTVKKHESSTLLDSLWGESVDHHGFPSQMANNVQGLPMSWPHHAKTVLSVHHVRVTVSPQVPWIEVNTLRLRQNGRHFVDDIFKCISLNENIWILVTISLKFVTKGPINNIPALVQIMAWHRPGEKPLSKTMMASLLTHIYVSLSLNELKGTLVKKLSLAFWLWAQLWWQYHDKPKDKHYYKLLFRQPFEQKPISLKIFPPKCKFLHMAWHLSCPKMCISLKDQ